MFTCKKCGVMRGGARAGAALRAGECEAPAARRPPPPPSRVAGERTHLDKCTIWHCSRENRRPCARDAGQSRAFAPQPALVVLWREPSSLCSSYVLRGAALASPGNTDFSVTTNSATFLRSLVNDIRARRDYKQFTKGDNM